MALGGTFSLMIGGIGILIIMPIDYSKLLLLEEQLPLRQ